MMSPARLLTAIVAAVEAAALAAYAISIAAVALTAGLQGPVEVSSPTGVAVEVVTFALFAVGLAVVAWGRWKGHGWSTVPFVVAQLLALTVSIPMATGVPDGRWIGVALTVAALGGLVALLFAGREGDDPAESEAGANPVAEVNGPDRPHPGTRV